MPTAAALLRVAQLSSEEGEPRAQPSPFERGGDLLRGRRTDTFTGLGGVAPNCTFLARLTGQAGVHAGHTPLHWPARSWEYEHGASP